MISIFSKFKIISVIFFYFILLISCSKNESVVPNSSIEDNRYKLVFSSPKEGYVLGDSSHKLIKNFRLQSENHPIQSGADFYFNDSSKNVYIFGKSNGYNLLYKCNIDEIMASTEFNQLVESQVLNVPTNERVIKGFVTQGGNIFTLNKVENSNPDEGDIFLRKFSNNSSEIIFKVSEILGFYPHFTDLYGNDIYYFRDNEELIFRTGARRETYFLSMNLNNETYKPFNGLLHGKVFGTSTEYFMIEWDVQANDELFDVLYDQFDNKIGEIAVGKYTGSSRIFASYAYDSFDKKYEYIQRSDGVYQMGVINTEDFTFEILSGIPSELKSLVSPIFYFNKVD
ncbi:hypothetical protein [Maribacter litoralis]|uniref:hypothetical protein n=1 Tax=Maribacter litoralis TaxID=2059726 RepID=UPI000E31FC07|nr:hypothetical protein [Maribacter litoralis]